MPVCAKQGPPWCNMRASIFQSVFLLTVLLITGCMQQEDERNFELQQVDTHWSNGQLNVTVHQKLKLSGEAKKALVHGVPLTLQMELLIHSTGSRTPYIKRIYNYEIRYLPLLGHYQLTWPGAVEIKTFPRLRHLLTRLSTITQSFSKGDLPAGSFEIMVRTHLDQKTMPSPMRLPMLFSADWRHDSNWTLWPVGNENGG